MGWEESPQPLGDGLQATLSELGSKVPARFAMIVDASGCSLATWGGEGGLDQASLSALAAADLAANREIARLTKELEEHQIVLREGKSSYTMVTDAGPHLVLLAQVSSEVPMGWARMLIKEAALRLAGLSFETIVGQKTAELSKVARDLSEELSRTLEGAF